MKLTVYKKSGDEEDHTHLSTSECAVDHRLSVRLLEPRTSAREAGDATNNFLPVRPTCLGTRLGVVETFDWVFLVGAGVVVCLATSPDTAGLLPALFCLALRVPLAAAAVIVSSSWEADPNRTCSSVSAASENKDRAAPRFRQESQHSLL